MYSSYYSTPYTTASRATSTAGAEGIVAAILIVFLKEQKKEYYASHREEVLQRRKEYYITHKQERIEYGKKYRKEIKEGKRICYVRPM